MKKTSDDQLTCSWWCGWTQRSYGCY